ncbi:MAG: site-2 protease family protein [Desulfococcaceae bacterium]|nr:site-2 protease family protein [Desulfococcaceae bacterium]
MELAKTQTAKMQAIRPKSDRIAEALEQGLQIPWLGVRPDLLLHKGTLRAEGGESYILEDPVSGAHFELGEAEARFFLCLVTEKDLKSAVNKLLKTTSLRPSVDDILKFVKMMQLEKLAVLPKSGAGDAEKEMKKNPRKKFTLMKVLFFRIPVLRPDNLLNAIYPWLNPLWSKPFLYLYAVLGLVGFISVMQQIELYLHGVNLLFTVSGALTFLVCLYTLKTMHEFGHALAAKHYGIFVRRMGIYMMLFTPMLYTDTTEGWKIPSRKARLIIGASGVLVEFYVACVSLFFWSVLPDGMLRSIMFYMSGISVISTVLVNINPFMRFDGYYLLMDYLRISNLRSRSSEMFKYYVRKLLFDWRGPKPEEHPLYRQMVVFGLFVNIYLIFITVSISLTIYHTVSKLAGLWGLVSGFFIFFGGTSWKETVYMIKNRKHVGSKLRVATTACIFISLIVYMFYPYPKTEKLPAVFMLKDVATLNAVSDGKIMNGFPEIGTFVNEGDILLKVQNEYLEQELKKYSYDLAQTETSIKFMGSSGEQGGYRKWLLAEKQRLTAACDKIRQTLSHMEIRAPVSGQILDVNETLGKGAYVYKDNYLLTIGDKQTGEIRAYAGETVYGYFKKEDIRGGKVVFQNLETSAVRAEFREMLDFPVMEFPNKTMFDYAGGQIPSFQSASGKVTSKLPYYPIIFDIPPLPAFIRHGTGCVILMEGKTSSVVGNLIDEAWRFMASEAYI